MISSLGDGSHAAEPARVVAAEVVDREDLHHVSELVNRTGRWERLHPEHPTDEQVAAIENVRCGGRAGRVICPRNVPEHQVGPLVTRDGLVVRVGANEALVLYQERLVPLELRARGNDELWRLLAGAVAAQVVDRTVRRLEVVERCARLRAGSLL